MNSPTPPDANPSPNPTGSFNPWTTLQTIISVAVVVATLLTLWTPANLFSNQLLDRMLQAMQSTPDAAAVQPTLTPPARPRIGIVAGHWGNDSGSVCADGLTEVEVNLRIATMVQQNLKAAGFDVDLLQEMDPKLNQYRALALVSIHNDSCDYINNEATGFKVAAAMSAQYPEKASRLTACLVTRYQTVTNLPFHYNTITPDMTSYHAFDEINNQTTAAIIETGFLNLDREILTRNTELVAKGVTDGIFCFIRNEDVSSGAPTPIASSVP